MKLIGVRGGNYEPGREQYLQKVKFTTFDSYFQLYDDSEKLIYTLDRAVTNHYDGYSGGILPEGLYGWICSSALNMPVPQPKVLYLFSKAYIGIVKSMQDLQESMRQFPSLVPNPNWSGSYIISQVLVHEDNPNGLGGFSDGCQTFQPCTKDDGNCDITKSFFDLIPLNIIGTYELKRSSDFKAPEFYLGK